MPETFSREWRERTAQWLLRTAGVMAGGKSLDLMRLAAFVMRDESNDTVLAVMREASVWADSVFTQSTTGSIAAHLAREAEELRRAPEDVEEMADVALLLGHLVNRTGVDLVAAMKAKLVKNRARQWGQPDADGVVEHVSTAEPVTQPGEPDYYCPDCPHAVHVHDGTGTPVGCDTPFGRSIVDEQGECTATKFARRCIRRSHTGPHDHG